MKNLIENIVKDLAINLEEGGYYLRDTHFELGNFLHCEGYYYIKKFFVSSRNCSKVANLLTEKLIELDVRDTTLVGYRSYIALCFSIIDQNFLKERNINYVIIEKGENRNLYHWYTNVSFLKRIMIVLPITVTCGTYIKIRKFIIGYLKKKTIIGRIIDDRFINLFQILDVNHKTQVDERINVDKLGIVSKVFEKFNWQSIYNNIVQIKEYGSGKSQEYSGNSLIVLYSRLYPSEDCKACIPEKENFRNENYLFPTNQYYETPNLIFGFPNFGYVQNQNESSFFDVFTPESHLSGYITFNNRHYSNYINGQKFYEKNDISILNFFLEKVMQIFESENHKIAFITSSGQNNSTFLEDLSSSLNQINIESNVYYFQPNKELIDNFISLDEAYFIQENTILIYYEDVFSSHDNFSIVNDYIKIKYKKWAKENAGFSNLFTLVNRSPFYSREKIKRELVSDIEKNKIVTYYYLNVPTLSASRLGAPIVQNKIKIESIIGNCVFDILKANFADFLAEHYTPMSKENEGNSYDEFYFPFRSKSNELDYNTYKSLERSYTKDTLNLIKIFITHTLFFVISSRARTFTTEQRINNRSYFQFLINNTIIESKKLIKEYVLKDNSSLYLNPSLDDVIKDLIIKSLCSPPFILYKNIYDGAFRHCVDKLYSIVSQEQTENFMQNFNDLRVYKFYIRRSIELNSNFIISAIFLSFQKDLYENEILENLYDEEEASVNKLKTYAKQDNSVYSSDSAHYNLFLDKNLLYIRTQLKNYTYFLLRCYKELTYNNPTRVILVEKLVNSKKLLPTGFNDSSVGLSKLIMSPYFALTGMIKAENNFILNELKSLHKKSTRRDLNTINKVAKYYFHYTFDPKDDLSHIDGKKNDPIIINSRKFLESSRHANNPKEYANIVRSTCRMLLLAEKIEKKNSSDFVTVQKNKSYSFKNEIREILDQIVSIIQPGVDETLKYAFCVEYKRNIYNQDIDNIYTILSDDSAQPNSKVNLSKKGLIYKMLYNLSDSHIFDNQQTLMVALKTKDNKILSFKDKYYFNTNEFKFENLYYDDCYDERTDVGLKILNDAKMTLFLRLSNLTRHSKQEYVLNGQAVLVICCSLEATIPNFLKFMSNEKIRNLLLLKDELMGYLQKQFDNDAFIDVVNNLEKEVYQQNLRHGLGTYLDILEAINTDNKSISTSKQIFNIISNAIRGQVALIDFSKYKTKKKIISIKGFIELITTMLTSEYIGGHCLDINLNVSLDKIEFEFIEINTVVIDVLIPEILVNIKKYCPRDSSKNVVKIAYSLDKKVFSFLNKKESVPDGGIEYKYRGGLDMCNKVIHELNYNEIKIKNSYNTFELQLSLKEK